MKGKAAITDGLPAPVEEALSGVLFTARFLAEIVEGIFGVDHPELRPAEYYVQKPDLTLQTKLGVYGVEFRLTGVSRGNRPPKLFHDALQELEAIVIDTIARSLDGGGCHDTKIQVFVAIMLDGDVPSLPPYGDDGCVYSSILESSPVWVNARGGMIEASAS